MLRVLKQIDTKSNVSTYPLHLRENEGPKLEEDDSSDLMTLGVPNYL